MPVLQRLAPAHAPALLAFERENRAYFAGFDERHRMLLAEQRAGLCHFHLLVDEGGAVLGRFNLVDVAAGSAELGFRVAERAAGRGLATAGVRQVCDLAVGEYRLSALRAAAARDNLGSHAVLTRTGFVPVGEVMLDGRPGRSYLRDLSR